MRTASQQSQWVGSLGLGSGQEALALASMSIAFRQASAARITRHKRQHCGVYLRPPSSGVESCGVLQGCCQLAHWQWAVLLMKTHQEA